MARLSPPAALAPAFSTFLEDLKNRRFFLRKPIALLFENENKKNVNPQNLRKRTLWHTDPRQRL